jgi:phosphatidyl-myo-inositol dimannoside synthase
MSERVKVLVLTPDYPPAPGGIQLLVHRLVCNASRLEPRVVTLESAGDHDFDERDPVPVRRVRRHGRTHRAAVLGLNGMSVLEALRFRPDAVLAGHIVVSPAAWAIATLLRIPMVQYLHAKELGTKPGLARFAVSRAHATIAVSRHTEQLAYNVGADPARVHRISPGVDLPDAAPTDRTDRAPIVVTIARMEDRHKGHDVMVRSMSLIRSKVPDVHWVVIGDGPLRPSVERLVAAHGLEQNVTFTGAVPDAERDEWLNRARIFAMPSRLPGGRVGGEGFGIVYMEASARGLPVVGGNVGGALDAVVDEQTGLLVDPTDHVAVAEAITRLLTEPERAQALATMGRKRAEGMTWPHIVDALESVMLPLVGRAA